MGKNTILAQEQGADEILKVTALLYLTEALVGQEFERCQELVKLAKGFGAQQTEITEVLTGYVRADVAVKKNGAKQENRLRLLKEE